MQPATRAADLELLTVADIMALTKYGRDASYEIMRACNPVQKCKNGELRCFASDVMAYLKRKQEETRLRNQPAAVRNYQRRKP